MLPIRGAGTLREEPRVIVAFGDRAWIDDRPAVGRSVAGQHAAELRALDERS